MVNACLNCGKYIFDKQNIKTKQMTIPEYVEGVIRRLEHNNKQLNIICQERHLDPSWYLNMAYCELCGAPHAIFYALNTPKVVYILFFFSASTTPSEKDSQFILEFKHNLFYS